MSFIDSDWYPLQAALILFFGSKVTRMQKLIPIENFHYAIVTTSIEGVGVPYARTDLGTCNILFFLLGFSRPNRDRITAGRNRIILSRSFSILIKIVLLCQKKASYTGPVDFKDTLGITLTIEQGLEKISVVFYFLISIFHGINSPLTDFTIIYGAEHVWEYGRTLLCWHYY